MIKNDSNVLLILSVGLIVIVSGCTGGQDSNRPIPTVQTTAIPTSVQTSGLQVQLTEVKYLGDCIQTTVVTGRTLQKRANDPVGYGDYVATTSVTNTPCIMVNIEINNNGESSNFYLNKEAIVTRDGRQLISIDEIYQIGDEANGGMISEINEACGNHPLSYFDLFPGARKTVNVCYPSVGKQDNPILYIGISINSVTSDQRYHTEQKEFKFDLTPYLP